MLAYLSEKNDKVPAVRFFSVKSLSLAVLLLVPLVVNAAGLGRLNMLSRLGQPLLAEIDLVSVTKEELSSLTARLASPDAYQQANVPFSPALVGARVSIERRPSGEPYIKITSSRLVNDPFIDMLVELSWSSGRLVREYTALIDPPDYGAPPASVQPVVPPAAAATPAPPRGAPDAKPLAPAGERSRGRAPAPKAAAPAAAAGTGEYGPVQRGDTLSKIAQGNKPDGVTLDQMLVSLYRANPDAFDGKNMNRLKTGKILRVPTAEQAAEVTAGEAAKEVRVQVADWNSYRQKLAEAPAEVAPQEGKAASGKIAPVDDAGARKEPGKDVVRLSKGEAPAAGGAKPAPKSAGDRLRMLEEEAVAREKALSEANERIAQLEKTIAKMNELLQLKGVPVPPKPEAAKPEAKAPPKPEAAKAEPAPAPKPEAAKPEPAPAPKPEAAPAPAEAKPAEAKPEAVPAPKPDAAEAPKSEPAPPAEAPKPKPKIVVQPPPPPPPPSLVDEIMGEPLYLAAGGGALALLLGGGFLAWKRRRGVPAGAFEAAPARAAGKGSSASQQSTVVLPEPVLVPPSEAEMLLDEASTFLRYGRDAQAEALLKEALQKAPGREDIQLKLLEIYAMRKDKGAFEPIARTLNATTGGAGETWLKVAAMGFALDPDNALYEAGRTAPAAVPAAAAAPASDLDFDLDLGLGDATKTDVTKGAASFEKTQIMGIGAIEKSGSGTTSDIVPDFSFDIGPGGALADKAPDITIDGITNALPKADIALDAGPGKGGAAAIDFTLEAPEVVQTNPDAAAITRGGTLILTPEQAAKAKDGSIDFDLGGTKPAKPEPKPLPGTSTVVPLAPEMRLDLGGDLAGGAEPPASVTATVPEMPEIDLSGLSLTFDETPKDAAGAGAAKAAGKDEHWYDVQTKFDLAKAYQEMGDKDGAREILQEILKEGDAGQKAEAQKLLESLG